LIEVKLTEVAQLFNSLDPSPFHERDLNQDAEDFIVSWALEHSRDDDLHLVLHLARPPADPDRARLDVETSVHHYFEYQAGMLWRQFRELMKEGRAALIIGLLFMVACQIVVPLLFPEQPAPWQRLTREGLTILGWVAMWRPLEIYLYRWWPLLRRRRTYLRLSGMTVEIHAVT
jgi:hypothetical protein